MASDGSKTVVYTAAALGRWEILGLRGLLAYLWPSPEAEVPAMPKAQVIQQIVAASRMYSFRFLLEFSPRVAGRSGVDPQCIARWDSLQLAGAAAAGRTVVALLCPGRTQPLRATYAIDGKQGGATPGGRRFVSRGFRRGSPWPAGYKVATR